MKMWLYRQKKNYLKKSSVMKDKKFKNRWENFISNFGNYFKSNEEKWDEIWFQLKNLLN